MHIPLTLLLSCQSPTADPLDGPLTDTADTANQSAECGPQGTFACPIAISSFPFQDARDTSLAPQDQVDSYACAPSNDESGPEWVYAVDLPMAGALTARLDAGNSGGVDIDLQILSASDAADCVSRGHVQTAWLAQPGRWYIVADSFVDSAGVSKQGAYELTVDFVPLPTGECSMESRELRMYWSACAPGIDCREDDEVWLQTPSLGPVVKEAHLVTEEEWDGSWPGSFTDGIAAHYALSEDATGYSASRSEPWAPAGEGGSEYGQGSTGSPVPAADEAWYLNMHWRDRPAKGTRLLVVNPWNGRAVVAAGGYETGPGSNTSIGGVVEEVHDHLRTGHRDDLIIGFLADQALPLGPIECTAQ